MGSGARILGPSMCLLAGAVFGGGASAATDNPDTTLLRIPITAPERVIALELGTDDLTVMLGEQVLPVDEFQRDHDAWQVVVYFDAPLSTVDGLRQAAQFLGRKAAALTQLGPTEVVLADPLPRRLVESTRDPEAVLEALKDVRTEAITTGELVWHRQRFSTTDVESNDSRLSQALGDEVELLRKQRAGLTTWLADSASVGPRLLILVHNGYDLNPRTFYGEQTGGAFLEDPRKGISQSTLSKAIAADGWTVVCLALGPRTEELLDPKAPLFDLARATGGEVISTRREGSRLLEKIPGWPILSVSLVADLQTEALPLRVLHKQSGQVLQTARWASAASTSLLTVMTDGTHRIEDEPRPVLQLLRPAGLALEGRVRFRTITARQRIDRIEFLLDDMVVAETGKKPFSAFVDLGPGVLPHKVTAVAYSRSNRVLGQDSIQLNMALEPPRVTITELDYNPEDGSLQIAATASTPSAAAPDRIEIFFNENRETVLTEPPYGARITPGELGPADFVRVVAHYPTGESAEAARMVALQGPGDELDVNLVQLLAMVTPRDRKTSVSLERSDFVVLQQGKSLSIDQFSHWEELQLTLGLVLDTSESMDVIIEDARQAGERFFQQALRDDDEAFVVDFNDLPRLVRRTTGNSAQLHRSLEDLEARGDTALYDAIVFSLQQFENTTGRRALVVVTDGEDSASYFQPRECVRQARLLGVPVYLIVLGTPPDPQRDPGQMRNLIVARRTGGEVYYISDLDDLGHIYDQIVTELRRQYFLAFNTGHTLSPQELEELEIEVVPKGVTVRTLLASQQRGG